MIATLGLIAIFTAITSLRGSPPIRVGGDEGSDSPRATAGDEGGVEAWTVNELDELPGLGVAAIERLVGLEDGFLAFAPARQAGEESPPSAFLRSADGETWRIADEAPRDLVIETAVVVAGTAWVVGHSGAEDRPERQVWTSPDGDTWAQRAATGLDFGPGSLDRIVRTNTFWLAQGTMRIDVESGRPIYLLSVDGLEWDPIDQPASDVFAARGSIAASGEAFVVEAGPRVDGLPDAAAAMLLSEDGRIWTAGPAFSDDGVNAFGGVHDLTWGPAGFVAAGIFNMDGEPRTGAWHSIDGLGWTPGRVVGPLPASDATVSKVIGFDRGYVAIGHDDEDGAMVMQSRDGVTWSLTPGWPAGAWSQINDVAVGPDRIVLVGFRDEPSLTPVSWVGPLP